ncbi:MAG: Holliday junction resolvase RuvX [Bacteroidetes bacterium]|nr:Holliday junction resolvase RuvX [Bacteroidota bacterium]MCW5896126.1 Holliday junction resolvase RuvX [Bacteroidota bacterium]
MEYPGKVLGIDYGSKRIGLAASDPTRMIAQAVSTIENNERTFDKLMHIIAQEDIMLIVVGMPYGPDGGKSSKAIEVEAFIAKLKQMTSITIDTWDESYSSVKAHQAFVDIGMKRKKRRQKYRVDVMAARLLLQEYLDNRR